MVLPRSGGLWSSAGVLGRAAGSPRSGRTSGPFWYDPGYGLPARWLPEGREEKDREPHPRWRE
jgi:hypothetical protein